VKIKVMLFGSQNSCNQLKQYLADEEISIVASTYNDSEVLDGISQFGPDIIILTDTSAMALRTCNQIYLLRPRCIPVVITNTDDSEALQRLMQVGVHYVFSSKISSIELKSEIKGLYTNESNRIVSLENTGARTSKSRVVTVFGPKSGLGKTTLAVNLAIRLAQNNKNKVVVVDYDTQFGDVSSYFGVINSKDTIIELLQEQANPNIDTLRQFLGLHISGVNYLAAPFNPEDAGAVSPEQAERIISTLRVYFDYVVVDLGGEFNDLVAGCLDISSTILLLSGTDVPSLTNTKKALSIIRALTDEEKIKLVLGKYGEGSNRTSEISRSLAMSVWATIPDERKLAMDAGNLGRPLMLSSARSKTARAISKMADEIDRRGGNRRDVEFEDSKPSRGGFADFLKKGSRK
jgi:hypothetical protein